MVAYIPLPKLYFQDKAPDRDIKILMEAERRLHEWSSFRTGIEIKRGEIFLAVPRQLSVLSEQLLRAERKVSQLWHRLPGIAQQAYLRGLIMDEIVSTNEIEGVYSTRRQIDEALESVLSDQPSIETKKFREFAKLYLQLTEKSHLYPKTPADIREIYDAVVAGELKETQQPDGELFRKEAVDVVAPTQKVLHQGVLPEAKIIRMLEQMILLADSPDIPPLFAAIITHFLFEYIHPFYDGNGRTGRYLLALYLTEPLSLATVLSLSKVIAENKSRYYKSFEMAENPKNYAELTFFVIQMLEFIRSAQNEEMENLENKEALLKKAQNALDSFSREPYFLSPREVKIMFMAVQNHLFGAFSEISLADISRYEKISKQTTRKHTIKLEEKGLLKPVSLKPLKFLLTQQALTVFDIADG